LKKTKQKKPLIELKGSRGLNKGDCLKTVPW